MLSELCSFGLLRRVWVRKLVRGMQFKQEVLAQVRDSWELNTPVLLVTAQWAQWARHKPHP